MLEIIIGLALLPFAVIGLMLLLGVILYTWRFIVAGLLFLASGIFLLIGTSIDNVWKLVVLYVIGALLWAWATSSADDPSDSAPMKKEIMPEEKEILAFMTEKERFTLFDIKRQFKIKTIIGARQVIDSIQTTGKIKPEGGLSKYWTIVKEK